MLFIHAMNDGTTFDARQASYSYLFITLEA